ncbi:MAG: class I SAM-dependent methyltransferase [Candidatus Aquicultor sp.]
MAKTSEHYDKHLAPYYSWLFGDVDKNIAVNYEFFASQGIAPGGSGVAVDLGAGSGFQSIALARLGFRVTAIDLSRKLLDELKDNMKQYGNEDMVIEAVRGDMLNFEKHSPGGVELFVCMGDTLTHLDSFRKVGSMCKKVYHALEPGGRFLLSFRDLTLELEDLDRFIPVRSDENTVFTCFLEYEQKHVKVYDLIYTRNHTKNDTSNRVNDEGLWSLSKSFYRKLRISTNWLVAGLTSTGFTVDLCENKNGMITIMASKP